MTAPLPIELVPKSAHGLNLRAAGTRAQWNAIKRLTLARAGGRCEICRRHPTDAHPLETHEVWHWDEVARVQTLLGTIGLCYLCHACKHPGVAEQLGLRERVLQHQLLVNDWTLDELATQTRDAWRVWARRSLIRWVFQPDLPAIIERLQRAQDLARA